jgi:flavin reductase (DIM6/NTAB) family NADH-FMN oxidoreductase RutF
MTFTSGEFRKALGVFPTGVAVVTTRAASGLVQGLTVSSFNSLSLEPPLVLFSVARSAGSFSVWQSAESWGISILCETQDGVSSRFAQSGAAKLVGFEPISGATGVPLVPGALAHFECERHAVYDGGDHLIFVGRVLALDRPAISISAPLVFFSGHYYQIASAREGASEYDESLLLGW